CTCSKGNGGGIYIDIDITNGNYFKVLGSTFKSCFATNTTNANIRGGYGSGIFLIVRNWINVQDGIDLSGAQYIDCEAQQGDKGLFIVMKNLTNLCQQGNPKGQYVRSIGYQDEISDSNILKGYFEDPFDFESSSLTDQQLIQFIDILEPHWQNLGDRWYIQPSVTSTIQGCGRKDNPCKTIYDALQNDPSLFSAGDRDYVKNVDIINIILLEDDLNETSIIINEGTTLGQLASIKSIGG
ncbi:MAG: hypothetical protein EZS28_052319, partial [Streblomastix strix]